MGDTTGNSGVSIRTYVVGGMSPQEFRDAVGDAIKTDACLTLTGTITDGEPATPQAGPVVNRTFDLWILSVTADPENFFINAQDERTHEWALVSVDKGAVTIQVIGHE